MVKEYQPDFSVDWFSHNIPLWNEVFNHFKITNKDDLKFLEIGCFEGRATTFMLENILTGNNSHIDVVDTFGGSLDEGGMGIAMSDYDFNELYNKFVNNIKPYESKVTIHRGLSGDVLKKSFSKDSYDFIYVDGSHTAFDVLQDAILAHPLLKVGGVMIFDDFGWKDNNNLHPTNSPELGIVAFLNAYELHYNVIFQGYQLGVVKVK